MKMIPVDRIPEKAERHRLQDVIKEFYNSQNEAVKLEFADGEYKNSEIAYRCIFTAAKRSGYGVKVVKRGEEVYLIK